MIRSETINDFRALDKQLTTVADLQKRVTTVVERIHARNQGPFLRALQVEPRRRQYPQEYPLEWTSEKQRRAYWASNGFGKGIPYKRTGKLSQGWQIFLLPTANGITINVRNSRRYAHFVVGKLRRRGQNPQQRFHILTGWLSASLTMDVWTRHYRDDFADEYRNLFD